jgi:hypothetical protein
MKKYLILCLVLFISLTSVNAQDKDSSHKCKEDGCCEVNPYAPQKGDWTAAMIFGRGAYLDGGLVVPSSYGTVSGAAAYANDVSANSNSVTNMVGVEMRYYTKNNFAITLSGGAILRNVPAELGIPAVLDMDGNEIIPAYGAVVADEKINAQFAIGAQWVLNTKNKRMFPYVGFQLPFDYARRSLYDPTVHVDSQGNPTITDLGARHVDITAFGVQAVAGIDYYFLRDVFFGFDVKPVSYSYAVSTKTPGPGLMSLDAETDTVSFFAQFSFKLGFKF